MKRNYPQLDIEEFGAKLLCTQDLDPVYTALVKMRAKAGVVIPRRQIQRWCLAYWCFYDCGLASYLSELQGHEFWEVAVTAAENIESAPGGIGRWPRGKERRHFRGSLAMRTVQELRSRWLVPEDLVHYCEGGLTLRSVSFRLQEHYGFGPWIGFKAADMLERVLGVPVRFPDAEVMMFDDPTKAALMLWDLWESEGRISKSEKDILSTRTLGGPTIPSWLRVQYVSECLVRHFCRVLAPPHFDRPVNIQEVETILCKWKSHVKGHYPLGNDIHEITEGVTPWVEVSPTAKVFLECLPQFE